MTDMTSISLIAEQNLIVAPNSKCLNVPSKTYRRHQFTLSKQAAPFVVGRNVAVMLLNSSAVGHVIM